MKIRTSNNQFQVIFGTAIFVICLTFSAAMSISQESTSQTYRPKVGEQHDDFCLPQIGTSKAVSLSDFRGKKILLMHFASW